MLALSVPGYVSLPAEDARVNVVRAGLGELDLAWEILDEYNDAVGVIARDDRASLAGYLEAPNAFWLALDGERVAGCVALRPLAERQADCEVKRLYVRPEYRGAGIASALMDAAEEYARSSGFTHVYLDTFDALDAAVRFYDRRGYDRITRYNDNPQATIFMRLDLRPTKGEGV